MNGDGFVFWVVMALAVVVAIAIAPDIFSDAWKSLRDFYF